MNAGELISTQAGLAHLYCPIIGDDHLQASAVTGLNVHVYDGSTTDTVRVQSCRAREAFSSPGSTCGAFATTAGVSNGFHMLRPSVAPWSTCSGSGDFAYLHVIVPPYDPTSFDYSGLDGYYMFN